MACCFRGCDRAKQPATLRIKIWPPSDQAPVLLGAHIACFENLREPAVSPDSPKDYGRIPAEARCIFCGHRLPIVGAHPFALEVEAESGFVRYWAHSECIQTHIAAPLEP